jgi:hypothetical protein
VLNFGIYRTNTEEIVEHLREKMMRLAEERGSLTHPDVIAVSQQLDLFFVQIQRRGLETMTNSWRYTVTVRQTSKITHKCPVRLRRFVMSHAIPNGMTHRKIYS